VYKPIIGGMYICIYKTRYYNYIIIIIIISVVHTNNHNNHDRNIIMWRVRFFFVRRRPPVAFTLSRHRRLRPARRALIPIREKRIYSCRRFYFLAAI